MIGHVLDLLILVLLLLALGFGLIIDRRVRRLMAALAALEPAVLEFSTAVDRSADTVTSLKSATSDADRAAARVEPAFRKTRDKAAAPDTTARVPGKSDLVRSFFETVRSRDS